MAQLELYLKRTRAVVRLKDKKHDVAFFLNLVHTVELLVSTLLILEHLVHDLTTLIINSKHVMAHWMHSIITFIIVVVLDELSCVNDLVIVFVAVFNFVAETFQILFEPILVGKLLTICIWQAFDRQVEAFDR